MIKIITLSRGSEKNERTIEATFSYDGELVPLKVNEKDRPAEFIAINSLLEQPDLDFDEVSQELFSLMSPEAKVRQSIDSSYYLSENLTIRDGHIFFGEFRLEETLADHMLSLLGEENVPKDEKMWRSYVKFLDNLHQNADEDVRKQLFRWMEYENKAGNAFGITDDGCLVGYKGCEGTVLEPMSVFTGNAIVDGVEFNGSIPNKVGSVIQMPRSAVQVDPAVGCSYGLHVGTRNYAVQWAPVLILVKVNPRDVVSVPYECESQKMRVCEYTVLKVTDAKDEHSMYHSYKSDGVQDLEENLLDDAYDSLGDQVTVEIDGDEIIQGEVIDVYEEGERAYIVIHTDDDEYENIELLRITSWKDREDDEEDDEEYEMSLDDAFDLLDDNAEIFVVRDDGKEYVGVVVDVYNVLGKELGVIIKDEEDKYSHIKLHRIDSWDHVTEDWFEFAAEDEQECDCEDVMDLEDAKYLLSRNAEVYIMRDDCKEYIGLVVNVYDTAGKESGIIIRDENNKYSHIKFGQIIEWEELGGDVVDDEDFNIAAQIAEEIAEDFDDVITRLIQEWNQAFEENPDEDEEGFDEEDFDDQYNLEQYKEIYELEEGAQVVIVQKTFDEVKAVVGKVIAALKHDMSIAVKENDGKVTKINFTDILSLQVIR